MEARRQFKAGRSTVANAVACQVHTDEAVRFFRLGGAIVGNEVVRKIKFSKTCWQDEEGSPIVSNPVEEKDQSGTLSTVRWVVSSGPISLLEKV